MKGVNKVNINFKQCNSGNFKSGRTSSIQWIVIHFTANNGDTAKNNADYFARQGGLQASAHYFVDKNEIWQSVKDEDTAWHCGTTGIYYNACRNANSIGIEMVSRIGSDGKYYIEDGVVEKARELVKYLMSRYNIPTSKICRHYDVTHKSCPEPWVRNSSLFTNFIKSLEVEDLTTQQTQALIDKNKPKRYNKVEEMPEYYREEIQEMIDANIIRGVKDDKLDLSEDMIRTLIMNWRMDKNKEG